MKTNYIPHKVRSHPLKCLTLPVILLFFFVVLWFVAYPLLFESLSNSYDASYKGVWSKNWPYYFWLVALGAYIFVLAFLVFLWRCTPNYINKRLSLEEASCAKNKLIRAKRRLSRKSKETCSVTFEDVKDESQSSARKSDCESDKTEHNCTSVVVEQQRSTLNPRRQFFSDLFASAHANDVNASEKFIEAEKKQAISNDTV